MKILFVFNHPLGSPAYAVTQYYPVNLVQLGYQAAIVAPKQGKINLWKEAGVQVIETTNQPPIKWLKHLRAVGNEYRPDIVHVFIHAGCGLYPLIMDFPSRPKFVLDIRSPLLRTGIPRYLIQLKNKLEIKSYDCIAAHGIKSAWTVIGKHHEIAWIPPGVDLCQIPYRDRSMSPQLQDNHQTKPLKLVYVGALDRARNLDKMISAVLIASKTVNLTLDIYGYGNGLEQVKDFLQEHDSQSIVRIMGQLPRKELLAQLINYDIGLSYVPTTLFNPAIPLKTLEYLACGLAVIATNTEGNAQIIESRNNGLLAEENVEPFANSIIELANDHDLRDQIARKARSSVENFDWKKVVKDRLVSLYEQVLN